ncbi:hypothetical protein EMN47_00820 [Prolixibacteraceae bacterium JC049]|nr:hypothetical protein [Prolixibacteraceae bacterium JC049]
MDRRNFVKKISVAGACSVVAPSVIYAKKDRVTKKSSQLLNAYYFRAHMYTLVPHQVREDLKWMADVGTNVVSLGVLEQDLYAAVENIDIICNEASKMGMEVYAVPSRWGGIVAGAPKVASVFTCQNPQTWVKRKNGETLKSSISGCISSIHHPDTYDFVEETTLKMLKTWDIKGVIWDEPKTLGVDYCDAALKAMNGHPTSEKQIAANVDFYSRINRKIKEVHPEVSTHFFVFASVGQQKVEQLAKIDAMDSFGCDGRPWGAKDGGVLESKGKTLLDGNGQRFVDAAHKNNRKGLWLIENHNMPASNIPILEKRLGEVIAQSPEHLIYYYFPRNLEKPYEVMNLFKKHLRNR